MDNVQDAADILLGYAKSFGIKNSGVPPMVDAENAIKPMAAFADAVKGAPAEAKTEPNDDFDFPFDIEGEFIEGESEDEAGGEEEVPGDSPADPDEDGGRAPKDFEKDNTPKDDADEDKDQEIDTDFGNWVSRNRFMDTFNQLLAVVRHQAEQINTLQTRIDALEANLDQTDEAVQGIKARTSLIGTY